MSSIWDAVGKVTSVMSSMYVNFCTSTLITGLKIQYKFSVTFITHLGIYSWGLREKHTLFAHAERPGFETSSQTPSYSLVVPLH